MRQQQTSFSVDWKPAVIAWGSLLSLLGGCAWVPDLMKPPLVEVIETDYYVGDSIHLQLKNAIPPVWLDNDRVLFVGKKKKLLKKEDAQMDLTSINPATPKDEDRNAIYMFNTADLSIKRFIELPEGKFPVRKLCFADGILHYTENRVPSFSGGFRQEIREFNIQNKDVLFRYAIPEKDTGGKEEKPVLMDEREWGEEVKEIANKRAYYSQYSCKIEYYPKDDAAVLPGTEDRVYLPLRKEHGYLKAGETPTSVEQAYLKKHHYNLRTADGRIIPLPAEISMETALRTGMSYSTYNQSYLFPPLFNHQKRMEPVTAWRLFADGKAEKITLPPRPWASDFLQILEVKNGLIVSNLRKGADLGIYLLRESQWHKISSQEIDFYLTSTVSPNGCRFTSGSILIDFCRNPQTN